MNLGGGFEEKMNGIKKKGQDFGAERRGEAGVGGLGARIGIRIEASLLNYLLSEKVRSERRSTC